MSVPHTGKLTEQMQILVGSSASADQASHRVVDNHALRFYQPLRRCHCMAGQSLGAAQPCMHSACSLGKTTTVYCASAQKTSSRDLSCTGQPMHKPPGCLQDELFLSLKAVQDDHCTAAPSQSVACGL